MTARGSWLDWIRPGLVGGNVPADVEVHVVHIQAAWRGFSLRCRLPVLVAALYTQVLVSTVYAGLGRSRRLAKALIAVRNRKVRLLRQQLAAASTGFGSLLFPPNLNLEEQLKNHIQNPKHRLRATLIIQAWWRGCRDRGWKGSFGGPHRRRRSDEDARQSLGAFLDGPGRTMNMPRVVYIFFSDTGGGHRASALALQAALLNQYGSQVVVRLVDFIREATPWPWCQAAEGYQVVGQFPSVYKWLWDREQGHRYWRDTKTFKMIWFFSQEQIREFLAKVLTSGVDLVISVHPLIHHLVLEGLAEMSLYGTPPVVTVVTDLGSAHLSWFDPRVDLLFVPSEEIHQLALHHGVPRRKIQLCGLPVREGFWRARPGSAAEKAQLRRRLGLPGPLGPDWPDRLDRPDRPGTGEVVLLMGGGEGFGNIVPVAVSIGTTLARVGRGRLVVICGRNEDVRSQLEQWPWKADVARPTILGFVANVDEYMSVADCLVTKAGPGSIAEAMIKGLPCLLTSFVPGQEEGNIHFVVSNGAGAFVPDTEPERVAETVAGWLGDPDTLLRMSLSAQNLARPRAALDITRRMGDALLDLGVELQEAKAAPSRDPGPPGRDSPRARTYDEAA